VFIALLMLACNTVTMILISECRERTRMAGFVTNFRLNQFIKIIKWIKRLKETHSEQGNTKLVL